MPDAQAKKRGRILMVDDEPLVARALGRLLAAEHDVTPVSGARAALDLLGQGERFDAILCDLMMPEMTGMELYAELERAFPHMARRTIFLTGGAFTRAARDFLARLPTGHLEKPPSAAELRRLVGAVVWGAAP